MRGIAAMFLAFFSAFGSGTAPGADLPTVRANPARAVSTMRSNRRFFWSVGVDHDVSPMITDGKVRISRSGRDAGCEGHPLCELA